MKILRVINSANRKSGGPIEGAVQITSSLSTLGHVTEMASLDAPDAPWLDGLPFPVHALGPAASGYGYSEKLLPWLRRHAENYDFVIVHGVWQYHSYAVWKALHRSPTPYVVYTHGMLDPWFKRTYPLKHLKKMLYWPREYQVLKDAQAVLFTTEEEKLLAQQSFRPYRCREIVVNYGTSLPAGDPAAQQEEFFQKFPNLRGKRFFLFLSRIHVKKGCDLLLEAFARIADKEKDLHLVMAGPDDSGLRASLERLAQDRGIAARMTWTGMLSGNLKWGAFHAAEAFALPSHQENFGIAVAEALACGLPPLISNKVNIWREILADGAGLVAEDDVAGATQLLQEWLALPDQAKASMRRKATQCFRDRFEIHQAAQSLLDTLAAIGKTTKDQEFSHVRDS